MCVSLPRYLPLIRFYRKRRRGDNESSAKQNKTLKRKEKRSPLFSSANQPSVMLNRYGVRLFTRKKKIRQEKEGSAVRRE
jgi:endonuclease V-like protein UPF0215 family